VSLIVNRGSAAQVLGLHRGDTVTLAPAIEMAGDR